MARHRTEATKDLKRGQKRPKVPVFGQYLLSQRQRSRRKQPSVEMIVRALREMGIVVDDATLRGYEYGWVDKPDPIVLLGLARLYKTDIHRLIAVLAENRKRPELSELELAQVLREADEHNRVQTSAAARLAEVQDRLTEIAAELAALAEPDGSRDTPTETGEVASAGD